MTSTEENDSPESDELEEPHPPPKKPRGRVDPVLSTKSRSKDTSFKTLGRGKRTAAKNV
jgi:hypothetical protein